MSFSDLPGELVRAVFEEIFHDGWVKVLDLQNVLSLRLVCKQFNLQVKHCALGSMWMPVEARRPWRPMSDMLLAVVLQQKVGMPQESDSHLVNKIRETMNALESHSTVDEKWSRSTQGYHVETLCTLAVSCLTRWTIFEDSSYDKEVTMLTPAAATGNISLMKDLFKNGADPNAGDAIFGTPLNAAAIGGHEEAADLLIKRGARIEHVQNTESGTALCLAARYGRHSVVRLLLKKGAKSTFFSVDLQPLHYAMNGGGNEAIIITLIEYGAELNVKTARGETMLHYGASVGAREAIITLLLTQGADIESKDQRGWTPLFTAAVRKREDMVKFLVTRGANIQATDNTGKTILHHLVSRQTPISLVRWFVNNGLALDTKDESKETALHLAVNAGQESVIALLLENGASSLVATKDGITPLHNAVDQDSDNDTIVRLLLDAGADVAARTLEGKEALLISATRGHNKVMRLLLSAGANTNAASKRGTTALQAASSRGHDTMVQLLLSHGADANAQDQYGIAALHFAAMEDLPSVVEILLKRGADPNIRTAAYFNGAGKGTTALHWAIQNPSMLDALLDHGASIDAPNGRCQTAFFLAASKRRAAAVRRLAERGADVDTTDRLGNTALHESCGSTEMSRVLLSVGITVDARNNAGETALHRAAHGYNGVLKVLLEYRADVDALDSTGRTALHRASSWSNGHEASMQVLLERGADREIRDREGKTAMELFRQVRWRAGDVEAIIHRLTAL